VRLIQQENKRKLRIGTVAVITGLVVVAGQRTGWPLKLYALVLVGIACAVLATTLPFIVKVLTGRVPGRSEFISAVRGTPAFAKLSNTSSSCT